MGILEVLGFFLIYRNTRYRERFHGPKQLKEPIGTKKGEASCFGLICLLIGLTLFTITGCTNQGESTSVSVDSIDAEEVLRLDPDADIFQYDDVIYQTNIDWVEKLSLKKDAQIGEIQSRNENDTDFEDAMSNKLPVGAKIFSAKEREDILLVESEGKVLKYLAIVEG
ncbi:hypothetical protein B14911_16150 [Bacillus sp. NRRL B-14911]|uniref:Uncharacterized protein n=1 Tax=Bacillus infantis NRRL B-14911 TaxID=1367477 RepID=U5L6B9_9BACI|nr:MULTISPECIES: hypothetical protein [Bacillus]AGX02913.1 hypothetical protein N288_04780 [Bacillus infantis NRRL B-14911]EAR67061.1 hypothetical protein B14911_16150 [Bacillus sp. NRRL B-14911]